MKKIKSLQAIFLLSGILFLLSPMRVQAEKVKEFLDSEWGTVRVFWLSEDTIKASYAQNDGLIILYRSEKDPERWYGHWGKSSSKVECLKEKQKGQGRSRHWGGLSGSFNDDGSFTGEWIYCLEPKYGSWKVTFRPR